MGTNNSGCLTAFVASFSRIMLLMYWISRPVQMNATFGTIILPCLGFMILPFTTLMYVWLYWSSPGAGTVSAGCVAVFFPRLRGLFGAAASVVDSEVTAFLVAIVILLRILNREIANADDLAIGVEIVERVIARAATRPDFALQIPGVG